MSVWDFGPPPYPQISNYDHFCPKLHFKDRQCNKDLPILSHRPPLYIYAIVQDGQLDADEFALSMHLINIKLDGFDLPDDLPHHLVPPSKKKVYNGNGNGSASGSDESY